MKRTAASPDDVDAYIAAFSDDVRAKLEEIRRTIARIAVGAEEKMSYRIPTFALNGNLIHFAAFRNHIGLYPGSAAIEHFGPELAAYRTAKGTLQLPLGQPIPVDLIERLVRFNLEANGGKVRRPTRR